MRALAWISVAVFWSLVTGFAHATSAHAWTCSAILVASYALVFETYDRRWRSARHGLPRAAGLLALTTLIAVGLVHLAYTRWFGKYQPRMWYENFVIDYVGGWVHLVAAMWLTRRPAAT